MASHASPPVACLTLLRMAAGSAVLPPAGSAGAAFVAATPAIATASIDVNSLGRFIGCPPCARGTARPGRPEAAPGRRDPQQYSEPDNPVAAGRNGHPEGLSGPVLWRGRYPLY